MERLIGELEPLDGVLEGLITNELPALEGYLEPVDLYPIISGDVVILPTTEVDVPSYDGSYEVTPLVATESILQTNQKKMEDDVVVLPIPYYETTNESGGYTVIIG